MMKRLLGHRTDHPEWSDSVRLRVAKMNLNSPCIWFLLTSDLDTGLRRLGDKLGWPWKWATEDKVSAQNVHPDSGLDRHDKRVLATLRRQYWLELEAYSFALSKYEAQWQRPLAYC